MKLHRPNADLFVPDGADMPGALARITHLGIGAHQDDLEFFGYHGISACFQRADRWFAGVVCTDGAGSSRSGAYGKFSDFEMQAIRVEEQRKAAVIGGYGAMIQLDYPSAVIKDAGKAKPVEDLAAILEAARPETVYLHNPADKHDTHVAVLLRSIEALRHLPKEARPGKAWGCEVWRALDWLVDEDKVVMPVSDRTNLQSALNGVFDSQITGGKRYDLAVMGRRLANATFFDSHATDTETGIAFAMDLTPLVQDETVDITDFTLSYIERLRTDVSARIDKFR